jgi:membrane protease YdiL (CAAX protease family)
MTGRERRALAVLVGGLAVADVARSAVVPQRWHLPFNLALGGFAVAVGRWGGLSVDELGCSPARARDGLVLGGKVFVGISALVAVAAVAGALEDDRTAGLSAGEAALRALVVIPAGTVVVEELIFRGALQGLLERVTTPGRALGVGAVLFGAWHLPPIWSNGALELVGTFVATTAAGVGFSWLRRRSGSVLAPMLAHLGTNSSTFALSWATSR